MLDEQLQEMRRRTLPWLFAVIPVIRLSAAAKFRVFFCVVVARIRAFLGPACGRLPFLGAIAGVGDEAMSGTMPTKTLNSERGWQRLDKEQDDGKSLAEQQD